MIAFVSGTATAISEHSMLNRETKCPTVAKQHYLHLTDLDFDRATGIDQPAWRGKMRATAGQKAGQQGAARRRITTHLELANIKKALQTQSFCIEDGTIGTLTIPTQVPPRGVEPLSLD